MRPTAEVLWSTLKSDDRSGVRRAALVDVMGAENCIDLFVEHGPTVCFELTEDGLWELAVVDPSNTVKIVRADSMDSDSWVECKPVLDCVDKPGD